jgi:hypothetical protein
MPRGKKITGRTGEDITQKQVLVTDGTSSDTIIVTTPENKERKAPAVLEKTKDLEKDTAPVILISWTDTNGRRNTRTYTCGEVRIAEDRTETLQRSGKKTTLHVSLEAQVLETDFR